MRSLIVMAHNLGLGVIAEGVETPAQADFLRGEDCKEAQGFLYAKPLPADEFEAYLRTKRLAFPTLDDLDPGCVRSMKFDRQSAKVAGRPQARRR
jgi:predicted signal transduction protein with EAL and GGDEF domain